MQKEQLLKKISKLLKKFNKEGEETPICNIMIVDDSVSSANVYTFDGEVFKQD